jgi:hypothetical protein
MANTYSLISTSTPVGSGGATNITFSGIPANYTDLILKASIRGTGTGSPNILLDINGVSTGRTSQWLQGNGAGTVSCYTFTTGDIATANTTSQTASTFVNLEIYLPNYSSTNSKCFHVDNVQENNAATAYMELMSGFWSGTSVISSLKLSISGSDIGQYSTAYLYGISNA